MKLCTKCLQMKPLDAFYRQASTTDGLQYRCKPCAQQQRSEWWTSLGADKRWEFGLWNSHKITRLDYFVRFAGQGDLCKLCKLPPGGKRLVVDHCHATGDIRGLIHQKCNTGLGAFNDDIDCLEQAIRYLEETQVR